MNPCQRAEHGRQGKPGLDGVPRHLVGSGKRLVPFAEEHERKAHLTEQVQGPVPVTPPAGERQTIAKVDERRIEAVTLHADVRRLK